ncbi:ABC-type polysaccharide/polyol phosphate transport system, ABC protein [alpha proteobacterium HIMB114]|nr:ABC-type polysaccharide/polyol phosphate transport system, ABC protein [alpha proteobacterium HIMB114]
MIKLKIENLELYYPLKSIDSYLIRARLVKKVKNFFFQKQESSKKIKENQKYIKALKNINFELEQGDRLGLIGLNGSGKSTLLKCLSNIIPISSGNINNYDNEFLPIIIPQSMCEPNDTIKNNLILLGYLLGFKKKDILESIDHILKFADLEKYKNLPFNTLSTGMKFRLVFSICFLIEGKSLFFIDEFLTTGDEKFQNKGFEYINSMTSKNIIILCSHSRRVIQKFCNKLLILNSGNQVFFGSIGEGLDYYDKIVKN